MTLANSLVAVATTRAAFTPICNKKVSVISKLPPAITLHGYTYTSIYNTNRFVPYVFFKPTIKCMISLLALILLSNFDLIVWTTVKIITQ